LYIAFKQPELEKLYCHSHDIWGLPEAVSKQFFAVMSRLKYLPEYCEEDVTHFLIILECLFDEESNQHYFCLGQNWCVFFRIESDDEGCFFEVVHLEKRKK